MTKSEAICGSDYMHGLSRIWFVNQVPDLSFFFFFGGGSFKYVPSFLICTLG